MHTRRQSVGNPADDFHSGGGYLQWPIRMHVSISLSMRRCECRRQILVRPPIDRKRAVDAAIAQVKRTRCRNALGRYAFSANLLRRLALQRIQLLSAIRERVLIKLPFDTVGPMPHDVRKTDAKR